MFWIWMGEAEEGVLGRPRVSWKEFKDFGRAAGGVPGPWDYWTNGPADVFALPLINFAVGVAAYREGPDWNSVLVAGLLGFLVAYAFFRVATKQRRAERDIDWWFRFADKRVRVSLAGYIHLVYFTFQADIAILGVGYLVTSRMTLPLVTVGLAGAFLYLVAFVADKAEGHFD